INISACRRRYAPLIIDTNPFERGLSRKTTERGIRSNIGDGALLALLLDLVERLGEALERILVGRLGAAARSSLHRQVGALAHGVDHARFLADVLDPGAIVSGVHRELGGADLGGGIGIGLERIADDDRHLVLHLVGGAGGDEDVGRIALAPFRLGLRRLRLGEREADLVAAGRGGIRAPVPVLAEQGGLRIARGCRRRRRGRGRFGRRGGWFLRRGGRGLRLWLSGGGCPAVFVARAAAPPG